MTTAATATTAPDYSSIPIQKLRDTRFYDMPEISLEEYLKFTTHDTDFTQQKFIEGERIIFQRERGSTMKDHVIMDIKANENTVKNYFIITNYGRAMQFKIDDSKVHCSDWILLKFWIPVEYCQIINILLQVYPQEANKPTSFGSFISFDAIVETLRYIKELVVPVNYDKKLASLDAELENVNKSYNEACDEKARLIIKGMNHQSITSLGEITKEFDKVWNKHQRLSDEKVAIEGERVQLLKERDASKIKQEELNDDIAIYRNELVNSYEEYTRKNAKLEAERIVLNKDKMRVNTVMKQFEELAEKYSNQSNELRKVEDENKKLIAKMDAVRLIAKKIQLERQRLDADKAMLDNIDLDNI